MCAVLASSACGDELPGLEPPTDTLYYPSSTTELADGSLLVVNGNFDLKFKTAWVNVLDIDQALENASGATPIEPYLTDSKLRILSHPGRVSMLDNEILLPHRGANHRGEALISSISVGDGTLTCGLSGAPSAEMTTLERATGCDEEGLIRLMPDGSNETTSELLTDTQVFDGAFEGAFHAEQFDWNDGATVRRLAAIGFLDSNWLWLFERTEDSWSPLMLTTIPVTAVGDIKAYSFEGDTQLVISGRGSSSTPGRFLMMNITESMIAGEYAGESFPFSDGLLARESVKVATIESSQTLIALTRAPDGIAAMSLLPEPRIQDDLLRDVPSFDLLAFKPLEGRLLDLAYEPTEELVAVSSYGDNRLWVGTFENGAFRSIWEWNFFTHDGYSEQQGPFGITWLKRGDALYLVATHFETHALSVFDFTNWKDRSIDIERVLKLFSSRLSGK